MNCLYSVKDNPSDLFEAMAWCFVPFMCRMSMPTCLFTVLVYRDDEPGAEALFGAMLLGLHFESHVR